MRVLFGKISDDRHTLTIVRDDGRREQVECETRSYLMHDLLHFAVESEGRLREGFWGNLAAGRSLAEMNDRSGGSPMAATSELMAIEQTVGALSGLTKGRSAADLLAGMRRFAESLGDALPSWLTESFIEAV